MALEDLVGVDKFIDDLVSSNPVGSTDEKKDGDDHIRGIKNVLKNSFPSITGAVTADQAELNKLDGVLSTTVQLNLLQTLTAFLDEDNMGSDSDTAFCSQQSIKAYVDDKVTNLTTLITAVQDDVNASTDGPGFRATHSTTQTVNNTTSEFAFDTEAYDTDNDFASNRFTPSRPGKCFVASTIKVQATGSNAPRLRVELRKNGTEIIAQHSERNSTVGSSSAVSVSTMIDLDGSTDYVSVFVNFSDANNTGTADGSNTCSFVGQWIRS